MIYSKRQERLNKCSEEVFTNKADGEVVALYSASENEYESKEI